MSVLLSYHQGFLLLQQMVTNTETMSRKWEALKHSILNRMSSSNSFIQGFHLALQPCRDTCHPHPHYIHSVWEDLNSNVLRRHLGLPSFKKIYLLNNKQSMHIIVFMFFASSLPPKNLLSCSYLIYAYCWLFCVYSVSPAFLGLRLSTSVRSHRESSLS